jgi:hypothetical protein
MRKRPPQEFFPVIAFLNEHGIVPEIVAGQAVNLWALHYLEWDAKYSPLPNKLSRLHPFTSEDLEILSGATTVLRSHPDLDPEPESRDPFSKAWSPDESTLYFRVESEPEERLKIQSMLAIKGVSIGEIRKRAIPMAVGEAKFSLPDPITLLQAKMANLDEMNQTIRQDERHVKMIVLITRAFIGEDVQNGVDGRNVLNVIGRLQKVLSSPQAKRLSEKYQIDFSDALPADILANSSDPKIQKFMAEGFPRLAEFRPNQEIQRGQARSAEAAVAHGVTMPDGASCSLNDIHEGMAGASKIQKQTTTERKDGASEQMPK